MLRVFFARNNAGQNLDYADHMTCDNRPTQLASKIDNVKSIKNREG